MLGINRAGFNLPKNNAKNNNQSLPQFKLKTLNKDAFVSFGSEGTEFVRGEAYGSLCNYIKNYSGTKGSNFLNLFVKKICETSDYGGDPFLYDSISAARRVGREEIEGVSTVLNSIAEQTKPTHRKEDIKSLMGIFHKELGKKTA